MLVERTGVTVDLDEMHLITPRQSVERRAQHAVAMEIERVPALVWMKPVILVGVELRHLPIYEHVVRLDLRRAGAA
ncbi:MAG: hypothetical protein WDO24_09300 [Pseudomonadota bacterium]